MSIFNVLIRFKLFKFKFKFIWSRDFVVSGRQIRVGVQNHCNQAGSINYSKTIRAAASCSFAVAPGWTDRQIYADGLRHLRRRR
jgi:hypothetical protein